MPGTIRAQCGQNIVTSNSDYIFYKKALNEATKQYKKAKKRFEKK
jgi:cation transport regulator ChaB